MKEKYLIAKLTTNSSSDRATIPSPPHPMPTGPTTKTQKQISVPDPTDTKQSKGVLHKLSFIVLFKGVIQRFLTVSSTYEAAGKEETLNSIRVENERTVVTHSLLSVQSGNIPLAVQFLCSRTAHCLNLLST